MAHRRERNCLTRCRGRVFFKNKGPHEATPLTRRNDAESGKNSNGPRCTRASQIAGISIGLLIVAGTVALGTLAAYCFSTPKSGTPESLEGFCEAIRNTTR